MIWKFVFNGFQLLKPKPVKIDRNRSKVQNEKNKISLWLFRWRWNFKWNGIGKFNVFFSFPFILLKRLNTQIQKRKIHWFTPCCIDVRLLNNSFSFPVIHVYISKDCKIKKKTKIIQVNIHLPLSIKVIIQYALCNTLTR